MEAEENENDAFTRIRVSRHYNKYTPALIGEDGAILQIAAQQSVQLIAYRRLLWVSTCVHIISGIVLLYSAFGGN